MSSSDEPTASADPQPSQTSEANAGVVQTEASALEHQAANAAEKPSLHKCTPLVDVEIVRLTKEFIYSIQTQEHRASMHCQLTFDSWESAKRMQTVMHGLQIEARNPLKAIEHLGVDREGLPIEPVSITITCASCETSKRAEFYKLAQRLANRIDGFTLAYDSHLSFVEMLGDKNEGQTLYRSISRELIRFRDEALELREFILQLEPTSAYAAQE